MESILSIKGTLIHTINKPELNNTSIEPTNADDTIKNKITWFIQDFHELNNNVYDMVKLTMCNHNTYTYKTVLEQELRHTRCTIIETQLPNAYNCAIGWVANMHPTKTNKNLLIDKIRERLHIKFPIEVKTTSVHYNNQKIGALSVRCSRKDAAELSTLMLQKLLTSKDPTQYSGNIIFMPFLPGQSIAEKVFSHVYNNHVEFPNNAHPIMIDKIAMKEEIKTMTSKFMQMKGKYASRIVYSIDSSRDHTIICLIHKNEINTFKNYARVIIKHSFNKYFPDQHMHINQHQSNSSKCGPMKIRCYENWR